MKDNNAPEENQAENKDLIPNFTPTPNIIFDEWMPKFGPSEWKFVCAIIRKIYGWHKQSDKISEKQIAEMTGLGRSTVREIGKDLSDRGYINRYKITQNSIPDYSINLQYQETTPPETSGPPARIWRTPPPETSGPPRQNLAPQNKGLNKGLNKPTKEKGAVIPIKPDKQEIEKKQIVDSYEKKWNEITGQEIKFSSTQRKEVLTTHKQYGPNKFISAIYNLSVDKWSKENNMVSINRLISTKDDKRQRNMIRFGTEKKILTKENLDDFLDYADKAIDEKRAKNAN